MADNIPAPSIESRKVDHIRINLEENVQFPNTTTGFEKIRLMHDAVPNLNLRDVDARVNLFGKTLTAPLLISSMTGGAELAKTINTHLAEAAQSSGIAMGLGSQRAAIEDADLAASYDIRRIAPDVLLFANIGAVQFNYGYGVEHCLRAIDMVEADALILHFNVLQEAVQPEGDVNWAQLLNQVEAVIHQLPVPVIAKEVGWGFSEANVRQLRDIGIAAIDVAGAGGTSWSEVEYHRAPTAFHARVAAAFADWGIPTADAVRYAVKAAPDLPIIASGGLRTGVDVTKALALGAVMGGLAGPFLKAAVQSTEAVENLIAELTAQIKIAMLCTNSRTVQDLKNVPIVEA